MVEECRAKEVRSEEDEEGRRLTKPAEPGSRRARTLSIRRTRQSWNIRVSPRHSAQFQIPWDQLIAKKFLDWMIHNALFN